MTGETAPDFELIDQDGKAFLLYNELEKNKKVMLVFYPKDNTPVCTKQLSEYQRNIEKFNKAGIKITAINIENKESHKNFTLKCNLNFQMLTDPGGRVSIQYHALNWFGINKRKIVIINNERRIEFEKTNFPFSYIKSDKIIDRIK